MRKLFDFLRRAAAVIVGIVFFLSGFVKLMDPVGTGLIVSEYYNLFGIGDFIPAKALGFALALVETGTAIALLTGVWRKIVAIIAGVLLAFFTGITIFLVIKNPAMDCGCFGEAIHLTHAQSLLKNIALCALWGLAFTPLKDIGKPRIIKYITFGISIVSIVIFGIYSLLNLPTNDHTPYSSGTELVSLNTPFSFSDANGAYCDSLLFEDGVVLVSIYDPQKVDAGAVMRFAEEVRNNGFKPLIIVSDPAYLSLGEDVYWGDRRSLMTINRSNGGATYVSDGQIIKKWSARHLPDSKDFLEMAETDPNEIMVDFNTWERVGTQLIILYFFLIMLLF